MQVDIWLTRRVAHATHLTQPHRMGGPLMARLRRQAGYTMVEIGLALVIMTLATVGIILYFSTNSAASQANALAANLTTLVGNVKQAYQGNYGNVSNARLLTGGFFNKLSMVSTSGGTPVVGLGGGTLTVAPGTVNTANDSVQYTITQVPDAACLPLISAISSSVAQLSIAPNGGTASVVKAVGVAPDPSKITCSNDKNTLVFKVL